MCLVQKCKQPQVSVTKKVERGTNTNALCSGIWATSCSVTREAHIHKKIFKVVRGTKAT